MKGKTLKRAMKLKENIELFLKNEKKEKGVDGYIHTYGGRHAFLLLDIVDINDTKKYSAAKRDMIKLVEMGFFIDVTRSGQYKNYTESKLYIK